MDDLPPYDPRNRPVSSFETAWSSTSFENEWYPDDYTNIDKQLHFSLLHGGGGAKVRYGCLVEKVDKLFFAKDEATGLNVFTGQALINIPRVHVPTNMDSSKPTEYLELGYYGDVYLIWEVDRDCRVSDVYFSDGPAVPDVFPYPYLSEKLTRKFEEGVKYGGYIKIGSVNEDEQIIQEVVGDVYLTTTIVPGDEDSASSGSDPGSSGDPGSTGPSSDPGSVGPSSDPGSVAPSSSGSDKSTAIVPVDWNDTGYAALFILEAPEVRFDDVMVVRVSRRHSSFRIDPRYISVCEPGSVRVCGWSADSLLSGLSAKVVGGELRIEVAAPWYRRKALPCQVTLRLTGIRKGFNGKRFPSRTREQFEANERFINSAYPADP